jgi:hypothetical protein
MFRHIFIFALFATCIGYAFASAARASDWALNTAPVWPAAGSDADRQITTRATDSGVRRGESENNVRIVSHIGQDMEVVNNINIGGMRGGGGMGFSGGANLTHGNNAPSGFNIWQGQAEMPLMVQDMPADDGGAILVMSRSGRTRATNAATIGNWEPATGPDMAVEHFEEQQIGPDEVKSWVVASGQTLREVLQDWADKEGWDLVWATSREYPLQASAVFKGRFMDVSAALVRNFSRATPVPYAKFYKGNRVLVISTASGE